jgi:Tfp pilus assembly protein PilF
MMKKGQLVTILLPAIIMLEGSCTGDSSNEGIVDCEQEYIQIVHKIENRCTDPRNSVTVLADLETNLSNVLQACPNHSGLRVLMADIQVSSGKNVSALGYIRQALEIDPDNAEAIHVKGVILSLEGDVDESLALMEHSLDMEPNNIDFLVNYCSTLESFSRYEEAIRVCSRALTKENAPAVVFYIRGRAYEGIGQKGNARLDFERARERGFNEEAKPLN